MIAETPETAFGVITPHAAAGPETEWLLMTAGRIRTRVSRILPLGTTAAELGTPPTSPSGLQALATTAAVNDAMECFSAGSIEALGYASTSTAYAIGPSAEATLLQTLSQRCNVPVDSTSTAAVTALHALNVEHVALVHPPWFDDELDVLGAAYFRTEGFDVTTFRLTDLPRDPNRIEPREVSSRISRQLPHDIQAVFIGGNGFRVCAAIEQLEQSIRRPVLTSNQVLLWSLLRSAHPHVAVTGYGSLFQQPPPSTRPWPRETPTPVVTASDLISTSTG